MVEERKKRVTRAVMIETLTREVLIEQIKRNIELVADGSHDDTINSLSDYLILIEKYAEEKGIKVICSAPEDIDELFLPYLAHIFS
ncbi:MAG: hypothetical protein ACLTS6_08930 [Anaerobutyricum sp.]